MANYLVIIIWLLFEIISCQELISPCPRLFTYEPRNPDEHDRWYGRISLLSDSDLSGVWLRIILDRKSLQLGNWFGEVNTEDNIEYLVKNRQKKLKVNVPDIVRFYIKYDVSEPPPRLAYFRLNGKTVCPEGVSTTEAPTSSQEWFTSPELTSKATPVALFEIPLLAPNITNLSEGGEFVRHPSQLPTKGNTNEQDDYFKGDLTFFEKLQKHLFDETTCGTVIKQPRPLITHGLETQEGEFPWHVGLYHAKKIDLTYICGGTLISRYHVLTVANCVTRRSAQATLHPSSLVVYFGKYYLKSWSNPGIQDRQVEKIIVHGKYDSRTFKNNIATLKLAAPVEVTDYVRPACLWEEQQTLEAVVGNLGTVVGWGYDENGEITGQLTRAHMPVVSQETCIYSFPDFFSRFTSDHTFCAGFRNGTSVCNGDSGGGMVFPKRNSATNDPVWQLRGMVSISVALQNQVRCDSTHYVVFTDIAKYLDWVKESLET